MMRNKRFGDFVKFNREMQGLSMTQLAKRAGVEPSTISRMEAGINFPTLDSFGKVMKALDFKCTVTAQGIGVKQQDLLELILDRSINRQY